MTNIRQWPNPTPRGKGPRTKSKARRQRERVELDQQDLEKHPHVLCTVGRDGVTVEAPVLTVVTSGRHVVCASCGGLLDCTRPVVDARRVWAWCCCGDQPVPFHPDAAHQCAATVHDPERCA